jgi:hypothetical protein
MGGFALTHAWAAGRRPANRTPAFQLTSDELESAQASHIAVV